MASSFLPALFEVDDAHAPHRVALALERSQRVELRPSLQTLVETVDQVARGVITVTHVVPRIALLGTARQLREAQVRHAHVHVAGLRAGRRLQCRC